MHNSYLQCVIHNLKEIDEMNVEELREICLSLKGAEENMPWKKPEYSMLVTFSVGGKWFCLLDCDEKRINVKCDPEMVQEMLAHYEGAFPAWHMNKQHWLGIMLESDMPNALIADLLKKGYELVVARLPRTVRESLLHD